MDRIDGVETLGPRALAIDEAKLDVYRAVHDSRISLCHMLPEFMKYITATMTPAVAGVVPAQQADRARG